MSSSSSLFLPTPLSSSTSITTTTTTTPPPLLFSSPCSVHFPLGRRRGRVGSCRLVASACDSDGAAPASESNAPNGDRTPPKSRKEFLLEYVNNVQPEFLELFVKRAPTQVVDAMRQTVSNMIGTLPPQFFAVTVTTVAENLAQLMYSVMMTGYMFKNAQFRLELQQSLEHAALPDVEDAKVYHRRLQPPQAQSFSRRL